ncbi:hypothetical protein NE237_009468 [Protea cynaroides]|uniref:Uncharacterized protein n=1 Tax=Protea cynaroides TaxID=273540 RepID=A0A9Q0R0B9_9MAGN|nr:hypothetical protein NE237_009468 [Protea cynaroides]
MLTAAAIPSGASKLESKFPACSSPFITSTSSSISGAHEIDSFCVGHTRMDKQLQEWARDMSQNDKGALANLDLEAIYQLRRVKICHDLLGTASSCWGKGAHEIDSFCVGHTSELIECGRVRAMGFV